MKPLTLPRPVWRRLPFVAPMFAGVWLGHGAHASLPRSSRPAAVARLTEARTLASLPPLDRAGALVSVPQPTTSAPAPSTTTTSPGWADPVTPAERAAWYKVNACEENGNWHVRGTVYSGGLGISETNWYAYGGQAAFGDEWAATPDEQIVIAMRIDAYPPDQNGCTGGW
jgi:hypothetical protein